MRRIRGIRRAAAIAVALSLCAPPAATALRLTARAAIVVDVRSGETLYARRADARSPIASTTKLMTALLTLERARPTERVRSPRYVGDRQEVTIGLIPGERMTVYDLLLAMLLPSANDAAMTLAHSVGGSVTGFVRKMNSRAAGLGLAGTHYANPIGLDDPHNYSTAHDLARLAAHLLREPTFAHIVDLPSARLRSGIHPRDVVNRNDLVARVPFVDGVKTGHTAEAGYVLVAAAAARGAQVVSVVLGEPDERAQDTDSVALLRFGLGRFKRVRALVPGGTVVRTRVRYYGGDRVPLVAARPVTLVVPRDRTLGVRVSAPGRLTGPIPRGRPVGNVTVLDEGQPVATVALVTGEPVKGAGLLRRLGPIGDAALAALACLVLGSAAAIRWLVRARRAAGGERTADDHHGHAQCRD